MDNEKRRDGIEHGPESQDLQRLERDEARRRNEEDAQRGSMTESEYREHLRKHYGEGKWADNLIRELEREHKKRD